MTVLDTAPLMGVDTPLDFPFFAGGAGEPTPNVPEEFQVALNGRGYIVDLSQYDRVTLPLRREPTDESVEPGEQSLNTNGVWRRSQDNWFLGAGQEYLDNRFAFVSVYTHSGEDPSIRTRFWRSKGVDPFTEGKLQLLPEQVQKGASSSTGQLVCAVGSYLYWWDGTHLKFTNNPGTGSPTWTTVTAPGTGWGTPTMIASDGNRLWLAGGSAGLIQTTAGASTATQLSATACNFVVYGNGWLIGANGPQLYTVAANGTETNLWLHPNANFQWTAGCGSPVALYLAGYSGHVSELYATQTNNTGALGVPYMAGSVSDGELIRAMRYYDGIVGIATSLGIRTGQSGDQVGHLTMGPVITDMGDCHCLAAWESFLYCGWSLYDTASDGGFYPTSVQSSGLGRLFLSEFTSSPLLPAYATDVMATDGTTGTVTSVAVVNGIPFFVVDGNGVWGPSGNKVASGYVEPGQVRYGIIQNKLIVDIDVRHDSLPAGGSIGLQVVPFGGEILTLASSATQGTVGPESPFTAGLTTGEAFVPIITLNRATDPTTGPVLRRWTIGAFPISRRQDQIVVPIIMSREVKSPVREGGVLKYNPLDEYQTLKFWESNAQLVTYQEGAATYICLVDQVRLKPKKWLDDYSFFEGLILVSLLTID